MKYISFALTVSKSRPKKPVTGVVQKKFIPKPRPVSAQVCRPLRKQARDDKPPFVSYGCMDKEKYTNNKKTYNVRASEDVSTNTKFKTCDSHFSLNIHLQVQVYISAFINKHCDVKDVLSYLVFSLY